MRKCSYHLAVPLGIPFVSKASFNVDKKATIDIGSNESKLFVFICTSNRFDHLLSLSGTQSSYLDG